MEMELDTYLDRGHLSNTPSMAINEEPNALLV